MRSPRQVARPASLAALAETSAGTAVQQLVPKPAKLFCQAKLGPSFLMHLLLLCAKSSGIYERLANLAIMQAEAGLMKIIGADLRCGAPILPLSPN